MARRPRRNSFGRLRRARRFQLPNMIVPPVPALTLDGPLTFLLSAAPGTLVATIGDVPPGVTPNVAPGDGRVVLAGDEASGWKVVVGLTAASIGTMTLVVTAPGRLPAVVVVTVNAVPGAPTLTAASGVGRVNVTWADGTAGSSPTTARRIYRSVVSNFTPGPATLVATNPTFPFVDEGVASGTTYFYKGVATNASGNSAPSTEVSAVPTGAQTFDYVVTNDGNAATANSLASVLALGGAALSGKRIGIQPGTYNNPGITLSGNAQPITFASVDPANPARIEQLVLYNLDQGVFNDLLITSAAWPAAKLANGYKPCIALAPATGQTVRRIVLNRGERRGSYRGNVAVDAWPLGEIPEYASVLPVFTGGAVTNLDIVNPYVGDLVPDGTWPITFESNSNINFSTLPTGWFIVVSGGNITDKVVGTGGASTGQYNVGPRSQVIRWQAQARALEYFAWGIQVTNPQGTVGRIESYDGKWHQLNSAFKATSNNGEPIICERDDFRRIYGDLKSFGVAGRNPALPLPPLRVHLCRGSEMMCRSGDPGDPHLDNLQGFMADEDAAPNPPSNMDWEVDCVGSVYWQAPGGRSSGQFFLSEVPNNGVAYRGRVAGNVNLGNTAGRAISIGRIRDMLVWRNVGLAWSRALPGVTMSMTMGDMAGYDALGHNFVGGNIVETATILDANNRVSQDVPNVLLGRNGSSIPYTTVMPGWVDAPATFADVIAAVQTAANYSAAGVNNGVGYIDYINRAVDETKEHPGVRFGSLTAQAANAKVWSAYWRVLGGPAQVPYSVPAGASLMVADNDAGLNAGSEIVGPATGTVAKGKYVRAGQTTSAAGSTSSTVGITLNGFSLPFTARTAAVLTYASADNQQTSRSATASPVNGDTAIAKLLLATRFRLDSIVTNGEIFGCNGGGTRLFTASAGTTGLRTAFLGSAIGARDPIAPAVGVAQTHIFAIDLTKTAFDDLFRWVREGSRVAPSSPVAPTNGTTRASIATFFNGGLGLFCRPDGSVALADGAIDMFYAFWTTDVGYVLPDITDPLVQDRFTRDRIGLDGSGPTGTQPQLCFYGAAGAADGSIADSYNATAGLANRGSIVGRNMVKQAGAYA